VKALSRLREQSVARRAGSRIACKDRTMKMDKAIVNNFDAAALAELAAGLGVAPAEPDADPAARAVALIETLAAAGRAADLLAALAAARPAIPWAELPYPAATLRRLHAVLCRRHTLDGLRTLAFRLGLDFDELPGDTKSARARELVLAMDRQGRAAELVARYPRRPAATRPRAERNAPRPGPGRVAALRRIGSRLRAWPELRPPARPLGLLAALLLLSFCLPAADHRLPPASAPPIAAAGERRPRPAALARPAPTATPSPTAGSSTAAPAAPDATPTSDRLPRLEPTPAPVVLVGERGANLRRGPGPEYAVVATLRAGARLELRAVSPTGEWYQVRLAGQGRPWIDARFATIIGGVGGAPVATGEAAASPATTAPVATGAVPFGPTTVVRPTATPRPTVAVRPTAVVRPTATPPVPGPTLPPP
jgi:hypothetical protein